MAQRQTEAEFRADSQDFSGFGSKAWGLGFRPLNPTNPNALKVLESPASPGLSECERRKWLRDLLGIGLYPKALNASKTYTLKSKTLNLQLNPTDMQDLLARALQFLGLDFRGPKLRSHAVLYYTYTS